MLSEKEYQDLHLGLFMELMEVLRVCKESKLTFYLGGETLLGAYLLQDFLPFSYKAEILMPREDFKVFRILVSTGNMLSRLYELEDVTTDPHYPEGYFRIRTRFTEIDLPRLTAQGLKEKGIFVEVRPLDLSFTSEMTKLVRYAKKVDKNNERIDLKVAPISLQKEIAGPFTRLINHCYKRENLLKKRKRLEAWPSKKRKELPYYLDLYSPYLFRDSIYPVAAFEGERTLSLRGWQFPVPSNVELYLRTVFGDYRNRDYQSEPDPSLSPTKVQANLQF